MRSLLLLLLATIDGLLAAYCGTSAIPYQFEVLPDGTTILGCARPACFGWEPNTGSPASSDASFEQVAGRQDGFIRNGATRREPFAQRTPQTSVCMGAAVCLPGQWVGGFSRGVDGRMAMICCTYGPLAAGTIRGVANIGPSQIYSGGEVPSENTFDYVSNIRPIAGGNGRVRHYEVEVGRFLCPEPTPLAAAAAGEGASRVAGGVVKSVVPPVQSVYAVPPPAPAAPAAAPAVAPSAAGGYLCFAADSEVRTKKGLKQMDELVIGDLVHVPNSHLNGSYYLPVTSWLHRIEEKEAEFLKVTTDSGKELKLTSKHLIYRNRCNSTMDFTLVPADLLDTEDCLLEVDTAGRDVGLVRILTIRRIIQKGVYAPLTDLGRLFVNGLAVSCYAESSESILVQSLREHFVSCDENSFECVVKNARVSLLLDMVDLVMPGVRK